MGPNKRHRHIDLLLYALVVHLLATGCMSRQEKIFEAINIGWPGLLEENLKKSSPSIINGKLDGRCALHLACQKGDLELITILLQYGALVDVEDRFGRTALFHACYVGNEDVMKLLIGKGANIDHLSNDNDNPLTIAVYYNHKEAVRILLDAGVSHDPNTEIGGKNLTLAKNGHRRDKKKLEVLMLNARSSFRIERQVERVRSMEEIINLLSKP